MPQAEQLISDLRKSYVQTTMRAWHGFEHIALVELTRALDEAAFAFTMAPNRHELLASDTNRHLILSGAATALHPILDALRDAPRKMSWGATSRALSAVADQHLITCGRFASLQRIASLERYGLASATFRTEDHLVLEVARDDEDVAERKAAAWLSDLARQSVDEAEARMAAQKDRIGEKLNSYTHIQDNWFLSYPVDTETISYHRDYAAVMAAGALEADALPPTALLGGRTFREWTEVSVTALGRALHHVACATRLRATNANLNLRNLLTNVAHKDQIRTVWQNVGCSKDWTDEIIAALTLDSVGAAKYERLTEVPLPYYIEFDKDFALLPLFGGLMNPHAGLVWHLRDIYRSDWDRAVDGRERIFRQELPELFPAPRFRVLERAPKIRRPNGTELTDLDAVIADNNTGDVALIQLKWPDLHGHSLAERESRRRNLLKANGWVEKVSSWVGCRHSRDIAEEFGLGTGAARPPIILVIARHAVRFSGELNYDPRALWASWPTLMQERDRRASCSIPELVQHANQLPRTPIEASNRGTSVQQLPGLLVEVIVR